jgi:hypothetical protein
VRLDFNTPLSQVLQFPISYLPPLYLFFPSHEIDSFTLTPPRMRMIVDAFKETLELGLEKPKQVVVRFDLEPYD